MGIPRRTSPTSPVPSPMLAGNRANILILISMGGWDEPNGMEALLFGVCCVQLFVYLCSLLGVEAGSRNLFLARACKRSRRSKESLESTSASTTAYPSGTSRSVDDKIQLACAWLPGRIAGAHVKIVAKHLVSAVAGLARSCGLLSDPASELTAQLGEPRIHSIVQLCFMVFPSSFCI